MKRQRRTVGAVVEIDLEDGYYAYGRILDFASFAFYDIRTINQIVEAKDIVNHPVLFIVAVYSSVVAKGRWLKIGSLPLEEHLRVLPMQFVQDGLNPTLFSLYNPNTGVMTPAAKEECKGLERAAVWDATHVEDRIRDHYGGRECTWLKADIELFA